ncbi:hypothetical protein PROVALCAL_04025 [Providencia alcalifaciens DSM 30120]|uniref:Uncharacterized protein n=1 Tax=Providencia alcalifaciens DSM 30120 TaxID=520999 RepID=B6XKW4_9GAMM|nr:hypothetical protein PROVALCAL_04025 [Providencia alcalifaciens DSM 30120]
MAFLNNINKNITHQCSEKNNKITSCINSLNNNGGLGLKPAH